jgi:oxaloacetate decarboxylase alpha subunit
VRPADLLASELDHVMSELRRLAQEHNLVLAAEPVEDALTYAMFPQVGWRFLQNRGNPSAFEPPAQGEPLADAKVISAGSVSPAGPRAYTVKVDDKVYQVEVAPSGAVQHITPVASTAGVAITGGESVRAPMAGHILRVNVKEGQRVPAGEVVIFMEAMKMETGVRARHGGTVTEVHVKPGDTVASNDVLVTLT